MGRRLRDALSSPFLRGMALITAVALAIVLLSLEESLQTGWALARVAFFLGVAFFLFLVWRERRSDIDVWREHSRRVFYAAIALAVIDIGALIGLSPSGPDAAAGLVVLVGCAYAAYRVWRRERDYA